MCTSAYKSTPSRSLPSWFILFEYPAACCGWDGATGDIIRAYIEKHGTPEEKAGYKQMQLLDF